VNGGAQYSKACSCRTAICETCQRPTIRCAQLGGLHPICAGQDAPEHVPQARAIHGNLSGGREREQRHRRRRWHRRGENVRARTPAAPCGGGLCAGAKQVPCQLVRLATVANPVTELAAFFTSKTTVTDPDLVRLTSAARAAGHRWAAIATACGIATRHDTDGVIT
jgi:hypothetical protein